MWSQIEVSTMTCENFFNVLNTTVIHAAEAISYVSLTISNY